MEKVGCTRQYESELSLRSFAQPFPSGYRGCANRPTRCFFSKTYPSFLTLKEGSTSLSKPLPSQKGKDVPTALSIVFTTPSVPLVGDRNLRGKEETAPLNSLYDPFGSPCRGQKRRSKPLRYKVGGPSEVYASSGAAVFCAGMNPLSLKDLLKGCLLLWDSLDR